MFPPSVLHKQLIELGLSCLDQIVSGYGVYLYAFNVGQLPGLVAPHIDQNEVQVVLHGADIVGERDEGVESWEVVLDVGLRVVQFDGLLE